MSLCDLMQNQQMADALTCDTRVCKSPHSSLSGSTTSPVHRLTSCLSSNACVRVRVCLYVSVSGENSVCRHRLSCPPSLLLVLVLVAAALHSLTDTSNSHSLLELECTTLAAASCIFPALFVVVPKKNSVFSLHFLIFCLLTHGLL